MKPFLKIIPSRWYPHLGLVALFLIGYGRLLFHPDIHLAFPENDTWIFPTHWSILSSLREGHFPLWNPLSAFGMPWMAIWQTEVFYPGTWLFTCFGLSAWNLSCVLHAFGFSLGVYFFLRALKVSPFGSFFSASIAMFNGCFVHHFATSAPLDALAWTPWIFLASWRRIDRGPWSGPALALVTACQIFAGYPQTIFYTWLGTLAFILFMKGWKALLTLFYPLVGALLLTACQWIPSAEYFFCGSDRLPAGPSNPHFYLPWENLLTFLDPNALARGTTPDHVASPSYFLFNFYLGLIPILLLLGGLTRFNRLSKACRFFIAGIFVWLLWAVGILSRALPFFTVFLEPSKSLIVIDLFELAAVGLLVDAFFPKPGKWRVLILVLAVADILHSLWARPLERNLLPPDPRLTQEMEKFQEVLDPDPSKRGSILILPGEAERASLYTPMPDMTPRFKHFVPNTNMLVGLPLANFYGSTWPTAGALNASRYFRLAFPYEKGSLLDMLGIEFLYLPIDRMPSRFHKLWSEEGWTLWKNPGAVGGTYPFSGTVQKATRAEIFQAFADGRAMPLKDLFLDPIPFSQAPCYIPSRFRATDRSIGLSGKKGDYLVVCVNASPGWRAWVDGNPSPLFLADGVFQAVRLDQDSRQVRLAYEPASFRLGLFVSLLTLVGFLAGFGLKRILN